MASPSTDRLYGANSSLAIKAPCRVATTANITLSGEQTIDGVAVVTDDRVLVKDQTNGVENGIYICDSSTWDRAPDFDGNRDCADGCIIRVHSGTANGNSIWELTTADPIVINTSTITFALLAIIVGATTASSLTVNGQTITGPTVGTHSVPVAAVSIKPSASSGCQDIVSLSSGSGKPDMITLNFDTTTEESGQFSIRMPTNWNEGTITWDFQWSHPSTTVNFGVVFGLSAVAVGNDDTIGAAFGTEIMVTDTGGTTDDMYISPASAALTVAGTPQAGDVVYFKLARKTGESGDTLAVDARISGITLYITTDSPVG